MSFVDRMVSATILSSDLKLEHLLRSEAIEENKNREGWNESRKQANGRASAQVSGPEKPEEEAGVFLERVKMFTSCALYSRLLEIPTQVERTWVLADFLKTASACPCPSSQLSCESSPGKRSSSLLVFN